MRRAAPAGRHCARIGFVSVLVLSALARSDARAQEAHGWLVRVGGSYAHADGTWQGTRANGKVVTSDIDNGVIPNFVVERRLNERLGITVGGLGPARHHFKIHHDFPDSTSYDAGDSFVFHAVTAGVALHLRRERAVRLLLESYLLFAWYDDVSLSSAGPPYDRTADIDLDVRPQPGLGVSASLEVPTFIPRMTIDPWVGLALVRFTGPYPGDPAIPGSEGDIGVGFSPIMVGLTIQVRQNAAVVPRPHP